MSVEQLEALIDFLEGQPELALGRCSRSKEGRSLTKRLWNECSNILNSISSDCIQKSGEQWRTYYNEYKHRLLKKIKREKNEKMATGGGPPSNIVLSPLQERLYTLLGRDVGEPLPGVRHNPLTPIENNGGSVTASYHDGVNVVTGEFLSPANLGFVEMQEQLSIVLGDSDQEQPLEPVAQVTFDVIQEPQAEPAGSSGMSGQPRQSTSAPRRRRRQRRENTETEVPLLSATGRLEMLEERSAEASIRLATAIEALTARLNEPITIKLEETVRGRKRRRIIFDSDSD